MHFRHLLLAVSLTAAAPLVAQPSPGRGGPWAADADGDGRITRDEMHAYMDRCFGLMDQDGDGLVQVQAMQRMLGHERQSAPAAAETARQGGGPGRGRGGPGGPGGAGGPGGPPPGGQSPPGGRPAGDRAAAPTPPPGRAMPYPEDGNDDGMIDRAEFLAPALAMFADQDRNGDGVLTAEELPPPPPGEDGPPDVD